MRSARVFVALLGAGLTGGNVVGGELPPPKAQSTPVSAVEAPHSKRWDQTAHGNLLRRILPPGPDPATLPEPQSEGARLLQRYCVQCHHLPSPSMHTADKWPSIVDRMVWRMEGKGNLGALMKELMGHVQAPTASEKKTLIAYLKKHGQEAIDPKKYPDLATPQGQAFELACSQCHAAPDPKRHTAKEWPAVVERMRRHLDWHGTIEGGPLSPKNAVELNVDDILAFLKKHSRKN